ELRTCGCETLSTLPFGITERLARLFALRPKQLADLPALLLRDIQLLGHLRTGDRGRAAHLQPDLLKALGLLFLEHVRNLLVRLLGDFAHPSESPFAVSLERLARFLAVLLGDL